MNSTHIHMLLNHFPIIGTIIGSTLLLWGIIKNQQNLKTTSAALLAIMAAIAIPVFLTGEPAEETVEKINGVSETMIELHEDAAKIAIWIMEITGLLALISIFFSRKNYRVAKTLFVSTLLFSILSFAAMARTGYYGGQIRHTELSPNDNATIIEQNASQESGAIKEKKKNKEEKEDDD